MLQYSVANSIFAKSFGLGPNQIEQYAYTILLGKGLTNRCLIGAFECDLICWMKVLIYFFLIIKVRIQLSTTTFPG